MKIPVDIALHKKSRELELVYEDGPVRLSFEYLRVLSPSAEVQGHSPDEAVLQVGKRLVDITGVQVVGNYAIQFTFSDGHDSGTILKSSSTRGTCSGSSISTILPRTAPPANRTIRPTSPLRKRPPS